MVHPLLAQMPAMLLVKRAAIADPLLPTLLDAMADEVLSARVDQWSLDSLARVAGVSRSTFAERFAAAIGEPPARYLTRWRMYLAGIWLSEEHATVAQVAARLGYDAEASFSRAFKRVTGVSPGQVRTQAGAAGRPS